MPQVQITEIEEAKDESPLTISPEKVFFIIVRAREFDDKDEVAADETAVSLGEESAAAGLDEDEEDAVIEELTSLINSLSEDEQIDLVALTWLGRDDNTAADWLELREEAARAHNRRTAEYLLGIPMLGDFLEEGLATLGYSCEEFEQ